MSIKSRGSTNSTREHILDAAARVILSQGTHTTRVEDVAESAGISPGLLYYHFANRSELIRAALVHALTHDEAQRLERILAALEPLLGIEESGPVRVRADALRNAVFEPEIRSPLRRATQRWEHLTAGALADAPDGNTHVHATALTALVDGLRLRVSSGVMSADEARQLLRAVVEVVAASIEGSHDAA